MPTATVADLLDALVITRQCAGSWEADKFAGSWEAEGCRKWHNHVGAFLGPILPYFRENRKRVPITEVLDDGTEHDFLQKNGKFPDDWNRPNATASNWPDDPLVPAGSVFMDAYRFGGDP
jgi:hypothetical protein